jgi:hypothetical protein
VTPRRTGSVAVVAVTERGPNAERDEKPMVKPVSALKPRTRVVSVELIGQRGVVRPTSSSHSAVGIHRARRIEGEAGEAHLEPAERGTVAVDGDPVAVGSHAR